ncbi:hypothetical protein BsWGS_07800 [Bradybaena similaris]
MHYKNLRDKLVHSRLPAHTTNPTGTTKCSCRGCKTCHFVIHPDPISVLSQTHFHNQGNIHLLTGRETWAAGVLTGRETWAAGVLTGRETWAAGVLTGRETWAAGVLTDRETWAAGRCTHRQRDMGCW